MGKALCQSSGSYFLSKGFSPEGGRGGLNPPDGFGISKKFGILFKSDILSLTSSSSSEISKGS